MTRTRRAALLLAVIPLFAACSSGSDGGSQDADSAGDAGAAVAENDTNGGDATGDGDVVTRNPSQSGEPAELSAPAGGETSTADALDPGESSGNAVNGDTTAGVDATGGDSAAAGDTGGATTGGDATTDASATSGDGGAPSDEVLDNDPLADIPLDQIESIEDETGLIIVDIPIVWIEIDTASEGDLRQLSASTDLAAFESGFATEGIALAALDVESGTADWGPALEALSTQATSAGCSLLNEEVYDDAVYRGLERTYDCPGADLVVSLFGGTNEDDSTEWTMKLITQPGDEASRALAFQSFLLD